MNNEVYSHYLLEVKREYTKQLCSLLIPVIQEGIKSMYDEAKTICHDNECKGKVGPPTLKIFQILLSKIPKWNQNIIDSEYQRIINKTQCDWMNDLITAVFISHAKILSSIKTKKQKKTLNLKIPNADYFVHKCYIECARIFWKNPYFFSDDTSISSIEYQRNLRETEEMIEGALNETIRKLLPVRNILQQYIKIDSESDSSDSEEESEDEKKPRKKKDSTSYEEEYITSEIPEKDKSKLKKSVKREIEHIVKQDESDEKFSTFDVSQDIPTKKKEELKKVISHISEEKMDGGKSMDADDANSHSIKIDNVFEPYHTKISPDEIKSMADRSISKETDIDPGYASEPPPIPLDDTSFNSEQLNNIYDDDLKELEDLEAGVASPVNTGKVIDIGGDISMNEILDQKFKDDFVKPQSIKIDLTPENIPDVIEPEKNIKNVKIHLREPININDLKRSPKPVVEPPVEVKETPKIESTSVTQSNRSNYTFF